MPRRGELGKKGERMRHADLRRDREDYLKGIAALKRREPTVTLEEFERRLAK